MDFPRFVFKSPGGTHIKEGSFNQELVQDKEEFEKMIGLGWNENVLGAIQDSKNPKTLDPEVEFPEDPRVDVEEVGAQS